MLQYAHERIILLPLDLAIIRSAEQNFRLDLARKIVDNPGRWEYEKASYVREAIEVVFEQGANYHPGINNEVWIHARNLITKPSSVRQKEYGDLLDLYFLREHLGVGRFLLPPPEAIQNRTDLLQFTTKLRQQLELH